MFGFVSNFAGECVRQMMLANDDLGVHAEIAGAAEDFDDAADGRGSVASVADEFGVDYGAIELGNVGEAGALAGAFFLTGEQLFAEGGREFVASGKLDFVLDAGIVGDDDAAAGGIAEEADDGRVCARNDAEDAAFSAACSGSAAEAGNFCDDVVAVHGVFDEIAGDEEIAVEIGNGDVGNDEPVAVLMKDEAAFDFVAGNGFVLGEIFGRRLRCGSGAGGRLLLTRILAEEEAAVGKFFNESAFFQLGEHLKEGAAAGFLDLERAGEVFDGGGSVSKL